MKFEKTRPHFEADEEKLLPFLSIHTRKKAENGEIAVVTLEGMRELAAAYQRVRPEQRLRTVLQFVAKYSLFPGDPVRFKVADVTCPANFGPAEA